MTPPSAYAERAARRHRAVHQPGLLVLSAGRQAARRIVARSVADHRSACRSTIGIIWAGRTRWRIRGHSSPPAGLFRGARRPRGLHAAGRGQRHRARAGQRQGGDRDRRSRKTRQSAVPLSLPVTMTIADGRLTVNVPARRRRERKRARSGFARSTGRRTVAIGRGENRGQTITYHNVVRRWVKLGDWTGKARDLQHAGRRIAEREFCAAGYRPALP